MKKLFSFFIALSLIFSVFINTKNVSALDYIDDQRCVVSWPYNIDESLNVFNNGGLAQTFVPTQNRLNILFLDWIVQPIGDGGTATISITDFSGENTLASSNFYTKGISGGTVPSVTFLDENWQQYDVPLTPGDMYRIEVKTSSPNTGVYWVYNSNSDCVVPGSLMIGDVMDTDKDFGFNTRGYNYVAPVIPPADTPAPVVAPTTTPTTPTADANTPDTTTAEPAAQTTDATTGDIAEDNVELVSAQLISSDDKMPSLLFWSILTGGIILLSATITFLQIKFKIFNKIFKSKKVKFAKK